MALSTGINHIIFYRYRVSLSDLPFFFFFFFCSAAEMANGEEEVDLLRTLTNPISTAVACAHPVISFFFWLLGTLTVECVHSAVAQIYGGLQLAAMNLFCNPFHFSISCLPTHSTEVAELLGINRLPFPWPCTTLAAWVTHPEGQVQTQEERKLVVRQFNWLNLLGLSHISNIRQDWL